MITTEGKLHIKRYQAKQVAAIAQSIAYGIGTTTENANDIGLSFEVGRVDVNLTAFDFAEDRLVFKGVLPVEWAGVIQEVGVWSLKVNDQAGNYGSRLLAHFDVSETWSAGTFTANNARVGGTTLRLAPAASTTATATTSNINLDLSGYSAVDTFKLAYFSNNAFTSAVAVRFYTDASNYYTLTTNPGVNPGYFNTSFVKSAAVATGTPRWSNITSIEARVTATAGGAASVDFDALRLDDTDPSNPDYVLVARKVLSTPITKIAGRPLEIEYSLGVTV